MAGMPDSGLTVSPEVEAALRKGEAVVALESTLITHGLPFPANAETALAAEAAVRASGAVPATIALLHGRARIGLAPEEIRELATEGSAEKASTRDLPSVLVKGGSAGTTVAATMFLAARAHIGLFATGGIGGVHRGAETTFDVSADLVQLGSTAVAVVAAGAKSILDIPKTLEMLETLGVPVIGYGSDDFPAFFSRRSGGKVDHRFDRVEDIARMIARHRALGLDCGILIANPIPEVHALAMETIESAINKAIEEARAKGITGKEVTPHILRRVTELSGGRSLAANRALIENNAGLAGQIAVALAALQRPPRLPLRRTPR
jgi:pseudouridine-5'-phosphate glycosidase